MSLIEVVALSLLLAGSLLVLRWLVESDGPHEPEAVEDQGLPRRRPDASGLRRAA